MNILSILWWGSFKRSAHVMCRTFWSGSVGFLGSRWPIGALFLFGDWQTLTCSNSHFLVARFCGSLLLQRMRGWKSFSTQPPSPSPCVQCWGTYSAKQRIDLDSLVSGGCMCVRDDVNLALPNRKQMLCLTQNACGEQPWRAHTYPNTSWSYLK